MKYLQTTHTRGLTNHNQSCIGFIWPSANGLTYRDIIRIAMTCEYIRRNAEDTIWNIAVETYCRDSISSTKNNMGRRLQTVWKNRYKIRDKKYNNIMDNIFIPRPKKVANAAQVRSYFHNFHRSLLCKPKPSA